MNDKLRDHVEKLSRNANKISLSCEDYENDAWGNDAIIVIRLAILTP